jgi:hypothetical protein
MSAPHDLPEVTRNPNIAERIYDRDGRVFTDCVECGGMCHSFGPLPLTCTECGEHPLTYSADLEIWE